MRDIQSVTRPLDDQLADTTLGKSCLRVLSRVAPFVEHALIERLHRHPEELRTFKQRFFEELVAELFRKPAGL